MRQTDLDETGLGLIEVVIAMFLLALAAVAMLPLFQITTKLAATNIVVGRASQLADQQVDVALDFDRKNPYCDAIDHHFAHGPVAIGGSGNAGFTSTVTVSACPLSFPDTRTVTITVTQTASGETLATATTLVAMVAATTPSS